MSDISQTSSSTSPQTELPTAAPPSEANTAATAATPWVHGAVEVSLRGGGHGSNWATPAPAPAYQPPAPPPPHDFDTADQLNPEHVDGLITKEEAGKAGLRYANYNHDGFMDKGESEQVQSEPKNKFDEADRSDPDHIDGLINEREAREHGLRYADYDHNGVMDGGESERAQAGPKDAFDEADFSNPDHIDGVISPEEADGKNIGFVDANGDGLMSRPEYDLVLSKVVSQGINPSTFDKGGFANIDAAAADGHIDGFFGTNDIKEAVTNQYGANVQLTPEEKAAAQTALQWMEAAKGTGTAAEEAKAMLQICGFKYDDQTGQWGHTYDKSATTHVYTSYDGGGH